MLKDMYNEQKNEMSDEFLAAVINLLLIGATLYGDKELMIVGENHI
jgi:hypothetical protein